MKMISSKIKDLLMIISIILAFAMYYFDLFKDGMVMSGFIVILILIYIALLWSEKVNDERDEYIRAKTGRLLYITTILALLADIVYKTFSHESYVSSVTILTLLALTKVISSRYFKDNN